MFGEDFFLQLYLFGWDRMKCFLTKQVSLIRRRSISPISKSLMSSSMTTYEYWLRMTSRTSCGIVVVEEDGSWGYWLWSLLEYVCFFLESGRSYAFGVAQSYDSYERILKLLLVGVLSISFIVGFLRFKHHLKGTLVKSSSSVSCVFLDTRDCLI